MCPVSSCIRGGAHLIKKAGFTRKTVRTGAATLIQRFGCAPNLNVHFHMFFLDGVYIERPAGSLHFRWVKAPSGAELTRLTQTLARRIGRHLERQGLLERDAENSYLAGDGLPSLSRLLGSRLPVHVLTWVRAYDNPGARPGEGPFDAWRFDLAYFGVGHRQVVVAQTSAARHQHLVEGYLAALDGTRTSLHLINTGLKTAGRQIASRNGEPFDQDNFRPRTSRGTGG